MTVGDLKLTKWPEHAKMKAVKKDAQIVGDFLAWLQEQPDLSLCDQNHDRHYFNAPDWVPTGLTIEKLLSRYFEIDLVKIGEEKDAMLEEMRAAAEGDTDAGSEEG